MDTQRDGPEGHREEMAVCTPEWGGPQEDHPALPDVGFQPPVRKQ